MFTLVTAAEWGPHAGIAHQSLALKFPLRRAGWPVDVASWVLFLASEAAGYVSGQTFAIDGGPVMEGSD